LARKKKSKGKRRYLKWVFYGLTAMVIASLLPVLLFRFVNPPLTARMAWERIQENAPAVVTGPRANWRDLEEISPHLRQAVLAAEDQRFLAHHGFDFIEIKEALKMLFSGKGLRGASTISMQAARTIFLWPARSWGRKLAEAYYTMLIEVSWSKGRILEIYLNTVDWGPGIMGVEAASRKYFRVSSENMTRSQAALLAAILPSPHKWSPTDPSDQVRARQQRILRDMERMPLLP
jgi:monofunctional biosynthetic peptidoglycan transglycosylase